MKITRLKISYGAVEAVQENKRGARRWMLRNARQVAPQNLTAATLCEAEVPHMFSIVRNLKHMLMQLLAPPQF